MFFLFEAPAAAQDFEHFALDAVTETLHNTVFIGSIHRCDRRQCTKRTQMKYDRVNNNNNYRIESRWGLLVYIPCLMAGSAQLR